MKQMGKGKGFALLLCVCLCMTLLCPASVLAAEELIIEHDTDGIDIPEYTEKGFSKSGVEGYPGEAKGSRTAGEGGSATWTPSALAPGTYKVFVWKVVRPVSSGGQDKKVKIEVCHNGKTQSKTISQVGAAGWEEIGDYYFSGTGGEFVRLTRITPKGEVDENGRPVFTQADSVKFVKLSEEDITASTDIPKVFSVDAFGATPDDGTLDSEAICKAIEAAVESGSGATVKFSKGTYLIDKPADKEWAPFTFCFDFPDVDGLTLEGAETKFLVQDSFTGVFRFKNGKNITVKGFTVDYAQLPLFQGEVTNLDTGAGTFDVMPVEGNPLLDDERLSQFFHVAFGTVRDPENPLLMKKSPHDFFRISAVEKLQSGGYRMTMQDSYKSYLGNPQDIVVGDKITFSNRGNNGSIFDIRSDGVGGYNENITISDVTVYASPHAGIVNTYNEGYLHVDNLKVLRNPERVQWMVTNTDAIFPQYVRKGVTVENSEFEGICDDVISIHQTTGTVVSILSDQEFEIAHASRTPLKGDVIQIFDRMTGEIKGSAQVIQVRQIEEVPVHKREIVVLDQPIFGVKAASEGVEADHVLNRSIYEENIIRNNQIRDSRAKGVFVTGVNNIIENNTFQNMGTAMIYMYAGTANLVTTNLKVVGNVGENIGFVGAKPPAIRIMFEKRGQPNSFVPAEGRFYGNIEIRDNVIKDHAGRALFLGNAESISLTGNNVFEAAADSDITALNIPSVEIANAGQIQIDGLKLTDRRTGLVAGVKIWENCDKVLLGKNEINVGNGVKQIDCDPAKVEGEYVVFPSTLQDIQGHWAEKEIRELVQQGIVKGVSDTAFAPEAPITRAEFTALVARLLKLPEALYNGRFSDVTEGDWFAATMETAAINGLIDDAMILQGTVLPNAPITREEMTSLIVKGYEKAVGKTAPLGSTDQYEDRDEIQGWAVNYVAAAGELGFVKGVSETRFAPKENATRAQAAVMIKRLFDAIKNGG